MVQPPRSHHRCPVSPAPGPHLRSRFTRAGLGGGRPERPQCTPVTVVLPRRHFSVRPAPTPRHGERLRLRLRLRLQLRGWRRGGEAGPGAHHGAGEGADRRGQRSGALAAHDGQVLSEVHREAWRSPGQLGAEVHRHVHGPLHGRLEHGFPSLQLAAAAGESQHVRSRRSWSRAGPCGPGRSGGCGGTLWPCQPRPWQSNNP